MSKETKEQVKSTIRLLQSISGSNVPYANAAGSVLTQLETVQSVSSDVTSIALPASVQKLIESSILPETNPSTVDDLLRIMDHMAQAILQVSNSGEHIDDQQLLDSIAVLREKFKPYSDSELDMESRYAHKEENPTVRKAKLFVLSDILTDRGLPVPEFWSEYLSYNLEAI